jgi:hypothetical protein
MPPFWIIIIAAFASVLAAYGANQIPPLKKPVARAAVRAEGKTNIRAKWWILGAYTLVVVVAVAATAIVTVANNSASSTENLQETSSVSPSSVTASSTFAAPGQRRSILITPEEGAAGSSIAISATGFKSGETVRFELFEGANLKTFLGPYMIGDVAAPASGDIRTDGTIPGEICCSGGSIRVRATSRESYVSAEVRFTLS